MNGTKHFICVYFNKPLELWNNFLKHFSCEEQKEGPYRAGNHWAVPLTWKTLLHFKLNWTGIGKLEGFCLYFYDVGRIDHSMRTKKARSAAPGIHQLLTTTKTRRIMNKLNPTTRPCRVANTFIESIRSFLRATNNKKKLTGEWNQTTAVSIHAVPKILACHRDLHTC